MLHAPTCLYGIGGLAGMLLLCDSPCRARQKSITIRFALQRFARSHKYEDLWWRLSKRQLVRITLFWGCTIFCRLYFEHSFEDADEILAFAGFSMVSGLFAAVAFYHLHNCVGLELMIDQFSLRFVNAGDEIAESTAMWSLTHVLLRRTAHSLEDSILALQTSVLPAVVLAGVHLLKSQSLTCDSCIQGIFTVAPAVALVLHTLFRVAAVTEKCIHMPAFMTSWICCDGALAQKHHHFIQCLLNSSAGFYIKGLRLTTFMVLKLTYFLCALSFSVVVAITLKGVDHE
eukprot:NODE_980_length_1281_cov_650.845840.p1 GENE.NODE_980_length_1281_cov_650.845840~~NODE_980_length_1281_cov_650.845840.p1  ORF type:complete len:333 (-),score=118.65 NODE_980_length_1281_cov_650.845840:268-1128(-)